MCLFNNMFLHFFFSSGYQDIENLMICNSMDLLFIKFSNSTYYLEHEYVHNTARSQIFREYLCENELLSKTILACLSGAQMALIHGKKKCQKIS